MTRLPPRTPKTSSANAESNKRTDRRLRRDGGPCGARTDDLRCVCQVRPPTPSVTRVTHRRCSRLQRRLTVPLCAAGALI